jgi:outer membrane immunogenic protein
MSMPYKAAPMQSVYNWTGFYIGGNAGGGLANSEHLDADDFVASDTKFQEAFGTVGVGAGYNYQFGNTVLGIEGDYNWTNVDKTKDIASPVRFEDALIAAAAVLPPTNTTRFQMNEFATIRARAGLALDRTLVYATAGLAFGHIKNTTQLEDWARGRRRRRIRADPELDPQGRIFADAVPELGCNLQPGRRKQ